MKLNDKDKVEVLLKLLEENRKQVEWVKELDYRVVYYTIFALLAGLAWLAAQQRSASLRMLFNGAVIVVSLLAVIFLIRNHRRHAGLNKEFKRVVKALRLNKESEYTDEAIYPLREGHDWPFHAGRALYGVLIIVVAILAMFFLNDLGP